MSAETINKEMDKLDKKKEEVEKAHKLFYMQRKLSSEILLVNDMNFLNKLDDLFEKIRNNEVIGTSPNGEPLTRKQETADLWKAIQQVKNGEIISMNEAIEESENWLK